MQAFRQHFLREQTMNLTEHRTLSRIRKGDIKSFENLFHHYYPGMCSYAESLIKKENVAEEIVQDVFYNIWKNRNDLRITSSWQSYLYKAVFNNSMMHLRKSKREMPLDERWAESQVQSSDNPAEELDAKELNAVILNTLQKLPERTRQIFNMNRFEGLKYKEIAEKLSISVKTVEANMGKALKALRSSLEEFSKIA